MKNLRSASLIGVFAGIVICIIGELTTHLAYTLLVYVALVVGVPIWMWRTRIESFWTRVGVCMTAYLIPSYMMLGWAIARRHEWPSLAGFVYGTTKGVLIGIAGSIVIALCTWPRRDGVTA